MCKTHANCAMRIAGFAKTSLVDWDGFVASTIYLPGCNFRCPACHNRDLVLIPEKLDEIPLSEIVKYLEDNADFIDGVVITGGEPTIQNGLADFIMVFRDMNLKVKLDTNGSQPRILEDLIDDELLDFVAMDIKGPMNEKYDDVSGIEAPLDDIKKSISIIMDSGIDYEFRTTVVPVFLDTRDIESIATYIGGAKKYALQQFQPKNTLDERFTVVRPYSSDRIREMAAVAKKYVRKVIIRGLI